MIGKSLRKAFKRKSDLLKLVRKYKGKLTVYTKPSNIKLGLLRFENPPVGRAFLFILPDLEQTVFHTIGMKFTIDIYFFDQNGKLIFSYSKVQPDRKIVCDVPCRFVIEIPRKD